MLKNFLFFLLISIATISYQAKATMFDGISDEELTGYQIKHISMKKTFTVSQVIGATQDRTSLMKIKKKFNMTLLKGDKLNISFLPDDFRTTGKYDIGQHGWIFNFIADTIEGERRTIEFKISEEN